MTAKDETYEQTENYEIYEQKADDNDNELDEIENVSEEVQQDDIGNVTKK